MITLEVGDGSINSVEATAVKGEYVCNISGHLYPTPGRMVMDIDVDNGGKIDETYPSFRFFGDFLTLTGGEHYCGEGIVWPFLWQLHQPVEPDDSRDRTALEEMRALLQPGFELQVGSWPATLERNAEGVADYGPFIDQDGRQRGFVRLLVSDGEILMVEDVSKDRPERGVFIPYIINTCGSSALLHLGLFQLTEGGLHLRSDVIVDDRAEFVGLTYLEEGDYLLETLTHGRDQSPVEAPDSWANTVFWSGPGNLIIEKVHYYRDDRGPQGVL